MAAKKEDDTGTLRITNQCRTRRGMAYGIRCDGVLLTLYISPRASDGDPGEWQVEAQSKRATQEAFASEWGATRLDALRAAGRSWRENALSHGLHMFDWSHVERVLHEVRAV